MTGEPSVLMVYMTAPSSEEASRLGELLVREEAAACVNILGALSSIYRWEGAVEHASEVAMVAKTTEAAYPRLEELVRGNHSYECPCIVAFPLNQGFPPFLDWVRKSVNPAEAES